MKMSIEEQRLRWRTYANGGWPSSALQAQFVNSIREILGLDPIAYQENKAEAACRR